MIFFAVLSIKRQKTFNDGGCQTTIKKSTHRRKRQKKLFAEINRSKRNRRRNLLAPRWPFFHPIHPIHPILPILSLPAPFIVPGSTPYPVPSPVLGPVSPWSPYPHPSGIFSDPIPVLAPFRPLSLPGDLKSIGFYKKNNFWKRVRLRQYFYDIFEESALQLPPLQPLRKMTIGTNAAQKRQIFYIFETVCIVSLRFS